MTEKNNDANEKEDKIKFEFDKATIWKIVVGILAVAILFLWLYNASGKQTPIQQPTQQQPTGPIKVDLDDDPVLGDPNSPVTIVSFEDYQCPFCGKAFQQTFPLIKQEYIDTGKVKYVYRDFPLSSLHPQALPAAEAAECADEQGKFWEFHEGLFLNQALLGKDFYLSLAEQNGLDINQFTSCIDSGKYKQEVLNDLNYGTSLGVSGTPTFFINGVKLVGAQPYETFKQIIDAELAG